MNEIDLFVIGGGSGGVRAARMAAQRGASVVLAESGALGGTCVNVGCIPKKLYSYAAHYGDALHDARGFGWHTEGATFDWARLKRNRAAEIKRLNGIYENVVSGAGTTLVHARARLVDAHTVQAGGETYKARHVLIATGARSVRPDFPGAELVVSSDAMFDLDPFPQRLVVIGGGYIACEFASIFDGLGSSVVQLLRGEQVLRGFDDDVRAFVATEMRKNGVDLRTGVSIKRLEKSAGGLVVTCGDGSVIEADVVLAATGRAPNSADLGLDAAGVRVDDGGAIMVDDHLQTSVPSIYAVGDVIDRVQLTPVALAEAMCVVDTLFPLSGAALRRMDYDLIPTAVFTHPNVGTVGLSEAAARASGANVRVYRTDFKPLVHTLSASTERTLMKLVVDGDTDRVLGAHMVGPDAGEIIQGLAVALRAGATKATFDRTIGIHPTMAEEFVTMRVAVG